MLRIDFVRPPNRIFSSGSLRSLVENPSLSRPEIAIFLRLPALAERTDTSSKIVSEAGRQALVHAKINCTGDATGRRKERASVWWYSSCAVRRADGRSDGPTDRLTDPLVMAGSWVRFPLNIFVGPRTELRRAPKGRLS